MNATTIKLFSTKTDTYLTSFKEKAKAKNIPVSIYYYENFSFADNKLEYAGKKEFPQFTKHDAILFRRCSYDKVKQHFWVRLLAILAKDAGAKVVNAEHMVSFPMHSGKLFQAAYFSANGIQHIATYQLNKKLKANIFPVIIKRQYGAFGTDSHLIETPTEFEQFKASVKNKDRYVIQPFRELSRDVRVMVLDKKIIGSVNRTVVKHADGHVGVKVKEEVTLTPVEKELAEYAISAMRLEFAGIDVFTDKLGKTWIGEINLFPNFAGYNKATDTDIFDLVIDYLL